MELGPCVNARTDLGRDGKSFLPRKADEVQELVVGRQMRPLHPVISSYCFVATHMFCLEFWKPPVELEKDITS